MRLTRRFEEDGVKAVWCRSINDTFLEGESGYEEAEKLSAYEDAEEQGLLIRLPCKMGDSVYYVQKCLAPSCKKCHGFVRLNNCYTEYKARIFEQFFDLRHLKVFGKTVFLSREEAEKALERMGQDE